MTKREKGRIGQSFEDFLQEQGRLEESTQQAVKRVIAYQLLAAMEDQNLTRTALAEKLQTSRSQINRLLDPTITKLNSDESYRFVPNSNEIEARLGNDKTGWLFAGT